MFSRWSNYPQKNPEFLKMNLNHIDEQYWTYKHLITKGNSVQCTLTALQNQICSTQKKKIQSEKKKSNYKIDQKLITVG